MNRALAKGSKVYIDGLAGHDGETMDTKEAINLLATCAIELGATANDDNGIVRALVTQHGLGFNAWFCVCCEIADRNARADGFKDQCDRAAHSPGFIAALAVSKADRHFRG